MWRYETETDKEKIKKLIDNHIVRADFYADDDHKIPCWKTALKRKVGDWTNWQDLYKIIKNNIIEDAHQEDGLMFWYLDTNTSEIYYVVYMIFPGEWFKNIQDKYKWEKYDIDDNLDYLINECGLFFITPDWHTPEIGWLHGYLDGRFWTTPY